MVTGWTAPRAYHECLFNERKLQQHCSSGCMKVKRRSLPSIIKYLKMNNFRVKRLRHQCNYSAQPSLYLQLSNCCVITIEWDLCGHWQYHYFPALKYWNHFTVVQRAINLKIIDRSLSKGSFPIGNTAWSIDITHQLNNDDFNCMEEPSSAGRGKKLLAK